MPELQEDVTLVVVDSGYDLLPAFDLLCFVDTRTMGNTTSHWTEHSSFCNEEPAGSSALGIILAHQVSSYMVLVVTETRCCNSMLPTLVGLKRAESES